MKETLKGLFEKERNALQKGKCDPSKEVRAIKNCSLLRERR